MSKLRRPYGTSRYLGEALDQRLNSFSIETIRGLTTFCKGYFKECLHRKNGNNIIYLVDAKTCTFGCYVSTNYELGDLVDEDLSREESADKIVYVVKCSEFRSYNSFEIDEMSYDMAFFLFGIISGVKLTNDFKLSDVTSEFLDNIEY